MENNSPKDKFKIIKFGVLTAILVMVGITAYASVNYLIFDKPLDLNLIPGEIEVQGEKYLKVSKYCILRDNSDGDPRTLDYWKNFSKNLDGEGFLYQSRMLKQENQESSQYWEIVCKGPKEEKLVIQDAITIWNEFYGENNIPLQLVKENNDTPKHYDRTGNIDSPQFGDSP